MKANINVSWSERRSEIHLRLSIAGDAELNDAFEQDVEHTKELLLIVISGLPGIRVPWIVMKLVWRFVESQMAPSEWKSKPIKRPANDNGKGSE